MYSNIDKEDNRLAEKYGITEEMIKAGANQVGYWPEEDFETKTCAIRVYAAMKSQEIARCQKDTDKARVQS